MSNHQATLTPEFILSEVQKLQYLYGLKHEIRYAQKRPDGLFTESVAEHIYGMHICAQYFLPLENPGGNWDKARIYEMITLHDIDEIETGDMLGYLKTDTERDGEREAKIAVLKKSPTHLQANFESITTEYENQETIEARFVKAIDRFEPLIQVYSQFGTHVIQKNKTTEEQSRRIKVPYIKPFPTMYQYSYVVHEAMINEGYFILKD
jgi:putative hydrolases of HD superfamily